MMVPVVCLLLLASGVAPVAAQAEPTPRFVVAVHADGSATVSVTYTFDLTSASERDAFRSLMNDEQTRADAKARFRSRMRAIANATENATRREMAVSNAAIDLRVTPDNETGVVTLSVTWTNLAATEGDRLIVTQPFASQFAPDRRFLVRAPDGYTIAEVTPDPDHRTATSAVWSAGTSVDGFRLIVVPETTPTETATGTRTASPSSTETKTASPPGEETASPAPTRTPGQPGFGVAVAVIALLGATLAARSRA